MVERSQKEVWRITPWLVLALLFANFLLMAFDAREINSGQRYIRVWTQVLADFVQSPVTTVSSGVSNYFSSISSLRTAQDENAQLKERIQELEVEVKGNAEMTAENERLRKMLDLKEKSKYKVVNARIIGRDPSFWFDSSIVNRGSLDGVKLYMPVVNDGGLIGRVTAVGPMTSQVDLITRDTSGVAGIIGEVSGTNALGVIRGSSKVDMVEMFYVPGSTEVQAGQIVYTSGQDGIYPAGLKIGEIVEVVSGSATTPHRIIIRPSASIDSTKEVGILLYEPPPPPTFDEKLPNALNTGKKPKT